MKTTFNGYIVYDEFNFFSLNIKNTARTKTVLVVFKNSWGEIDVLLPVLVSLKNENKSTKIVSIIESRDMMGNDKFMPVLFEMLKKWERFIYLSRKLCKKK